MGSHLVDYLIQKGHRVHALDDLSGGYIENVNKKAKFWKVDLRDKQATRKVVEKIKPEIIYHLAADAAEGRSQFAPRNCAERNYLATLNLLVPAVKVGTKHFVFTSSMAVYGEQKPPFTEDMKPMPQDIYGISKFAAEESIKVLGKVHGFEWVIARPHNVYGERQNMADPYRNVIAIFMNRIVKRKKIYIYGDGRQKRAFSYIGDITPILAKCGFSREAVGQIFNLGSDTPHTINQLAEIIMRVSGITVERKYLPPRPQEVKNAFSNQTKAKRILGYKDKTSLIDGIAKMWRWAKEKGAIKPRYTEAEIINDKMPLTWKKRLI